MVDVSYLSHLTPEQISFSGKFLESVFLNKESNISQADDDHLHCIYSIVSAVPSTDMRHQILLALDVDTRLSVCDRLDPSAQGELFTYMDDMGFLKAFFQHLSEETKHHVLQYLYREDRYKYGIFKALMSHKVSMIGGIVVKQDHILKKFLDREQDHLLDIFQNPKVAMVKIQPLCKRLEARFELDDIELLCLGLIKQFSLLKVPINTAQTFAVHLKFYTFIDYFLAIFPDMGSHLKTCIDAFILSLKDMPNGQWMVKVINQLPKMVIGLVMEQLKNYERIASFEKRNLYCTILGKIRENLNSPDGKRVLMAYQRY